MLTLFFYDIYSFHIGKSIKNDGKKKIEIAILEYSITFQKYQNMIVATIYQFWNSFLTSQF